MFIQLIYFNFKSTYEKKKNNIGSLFQFQLKYNKMPSND